MMSRWTEISKHILLTMSVSQFVAGMDAVHVHLRDDDVADEENGEEREGGDEHHAEGAPVGTVLLQARH